MPCKKGKEKCKCEVKCCVERPKCPRFDCDQLLDKKYNGSKYGGILNFGGAVKSTGTYSALLPYNHLSNRSAVDLSPVQPTIITDTNLGITNPIQDSGSQSGVQVTRLVVNVTQPPTEPVTIRLYQRIDDTVLPTSLVATVQPGSKRATSHTDGVPVYSGNQFLLIVEPTATSQFLGFVDASASYNVTEF